MRIPLFIRSDGFAEQFKSRFVFHLIARMDKKFKVEWCYNERHHGKGPMDRIGATIKNKIFLFVKSGKVYVKYAKSFPEYADLAIDIIKSHYLSANDVLKETDDIDSAPKETSILEFHQVKREFNVDGVCKLHFFEVASDSLPFHEEFSRKYGDPEMCDHPFLSLSFNLDNTYAACKDSFLGNEDWLECNICEQWFHESCFMA